ncbi:MAG: ATP-binding protein, partial [Bacteroidaceae bacterium]
LIPEYLPLGLIYYDKDGYLKYLNHVALKMFGVTVEDAYNLKLFEDPNITAEDKEKLRNGQNVSFETDYDFGVGFYNTILKEERKYFVTKIAVIKDTDDNLQGYILNCEDITEKKAQESEIIKSYKKIKSTQKELSLALNAGNLTAWNYNIKEETFYKFCEQIEGGEKHSFESIYKRIHPDDKNLFLALLNSSIQERKISDNNLVLRILDINRKEYRHCNFIYNIKEDEEGNTIGITFIQQDITEDVKYQQNLISAKNKAEEADKLKSTFLATMSHEIRTPLNAIVGFSQLIADTVNTEEKNEYKQLIETNSEILLKLIGDILDLSKIEAGFIEINRQELDVALLCQELYQSFKQRIKNTNVALRLVAPYTKCVANLDRNRFIQIFTNFVTNAIKYTPQGEIVMGYECKPGQIKFYVKDTGIGIADEKKDRIFSRFEKLDNFAQGTGLGLSICKAIADATNEEIGFESKVDEGSKFWYIAHTDIEFTEKSQSQEDENSTETTEQDLSPLLANIKELNILVAEDNDSNFLLMRNILKENYLTRAITGIDAVQK